MSEEATFVVPVRLENGMTVHVEVRDLGGREKVTDLRDLPFKDVMTSIEAIASEIGGLLKRLAPEKASIEMGFEIAAESGQLTALLVKGSGKANLKVALEWTRSAK